MGGVGFLTSPLPIFIPHLTSQIEDFSLFRACCLGLQEDLTR